ncbi:hypothetical protein IT413_05960 [Candidatus Peregrinibacteria bacterium]|nr:hypothetical protein [Candidatus Peregrinibacteria bacterium]
MTDQKLYELCKKYGAQTLSARRKFAGLLPEAFRRRLYQKKGFSSIFEFAAKLAGISQDQVRVVLNLEKRYEDKPVLKNLLINGEVSINKLARIVSVATIENQKELADKVMILPKNALETLVRDEKFTQQKSGATIPGSEENSNRQSSLQKTLFIPEGLPGQTHNLNFELSEDIKKELNDLHSKGINVNELLQEMLEKRKENITQEKEKISQEMHQETNHATTVHPQSYKSTSRYIPVRIKKILHQEYGTKCSIHTCKKPSKQIHHTQRFSLTQNHDAKYLAPLCVEHHIIAHSIDLKFHGARQMALS